jgi:hypothetical protein
LQQWRKSMHPCWRVRGKNLSNVICLGLQFREAVTFLRQSTSDHVRPKHLRWNDVKRAGEVLSHGLSLPPCSPI